jgi:hypothetical protein
MATDQSNAHRQEGKDSSDVSNGSEGIHMAANDALVLIVMVTAAVLMISFWKQILVLMLLALVTVFCFGLYNVVYRIPG